MTLIETPGSIAVPALDIEGLSYVYPDGTPGLRDVSLRVEQGERIALIRTARGSPRSSST